MAQVSITLGNATYAVGCQDGQEGRVRQLAQLVENKLAHIRASLSPVNDTHALFLTALLLVDENQDLQAAKMTESDRKKLDELRHMTEHNAGETERLVQAATLAEKLARRVTEENVEEKD